MCAVRCLLLHFSYFFNATIKVRYVSACVLHRRLILLAMAPIGKQVKAISRLLLIFPVFCLCLRVQSNGFCPLMCLSVHRPNWQR